MKKLRKYIYQIILFLSLTGGLVAMSNASTTQTQQVTVIVNGIDIKRGGNIMTMLFSKDGFPKNHAKAITIQNKTVIAESMEFFV